MARADLRQDVVHRARLALGERLRGELQRQAQRRAANREIFYTLAEAKALVQGWRREYNQVPPHSSLGYRPPAPEATCQYRFYELGSGPITWGMSGGQEA